MDVGHYILDGNADAVEFCPDDSFHNVLAASTYVLQEGDKPSRSGCIALFHVDADAGRLELVQKVDTAGIFDIKWSPVSAQGSLTHPLLAQADADGYIRIHSLQGSASDGLEAQGMSEFKLVYCTVLIVLVLDRRLGILEVCDDHIYSFFFFFL